MTLLGKHLQVEFENIGMAYTRDWEKKRMREVAVCSYSFKLPYLKTQFYYLRLKIAKKQFNRSVCNKAFESFTVHSTKSRRINYVPLEHTKILRKNKIYYNEKKRKKRTGYLAEKNFVELKDGIAFSKQKMSFLSLSLSMSVCLSVCLFVCLSLSHSLSLSFSLSLTHSLSLSLSLTLSPSLSLSLTLSLSLSLSLSLFFLSLSPSSISFSFSKSSLCSMVV